MNGFLSTENELRLTTERCQKYQGTAKINIDQIVPHSFVARNLDRHNVERLCEVFHKEGCRRIAIHHHISAVVSKQDLHEALRVAGVEAAEMMAGPDRYPHLSFLNGQIQCLHGQHRLKAGEEHLPPYDQWWTVDLYLNDISPDLQNSLVDEYSNERVPSDGEIYRKVRQYRQEANAHFENRWLARLSDNKARRLRGLESHPNIRSAFDSLLMVPALLVHGMQIGSLAELLALNCDEEVVHALNELREYWSSLMKHDHKRMLRIDVHTVEKLQLLTPTASSKDRTKVKGLVHSGEVFANFTPSERSSIWRRMKKKEGIIPSLHTFFKNLWYLESCVNCMKHLFSPSKDFPTMKGTMRAAFSPFSPMDTQFHIQVSEASFRSYSPLEADPLEIGYRQLWLYAMRYYPQLSKKPQKKNVAAKAERGVVDHMLLHDMAILARRLGFKTPQIEQIIQQSPDRKIALEALMRARQADRFRYEDGQLESLIDEITKCFSQAVPLSDEIAHQCATGRETKKESRVGHPDERTQYQDRYFLFLDQLHGPASALQKATTTYVRRSIYFTFFNKLKLPEGTSSTTNERGSGDRAEVSMSSLFVAPSSQNQVYDETGSSASSSSANRSPNTEDERSARRNDRRKGKSKKRQQRERQASQLFVDEQPSEILGEKITTPLVVSSKDTFDVESIESIDMEDLDQQITPQPCQSDSPMEPLFESESNTVENTFTSEEEDQEMSAEEQMPMEMNGHESMFAEDADKEHVGREEVSEEEGQPSALKERDNTLKKLEGLPLSRVHGPLRTDKRKGKLRKEEATWKPYGRQQRRPLTNLSALPSQETLEGDIMTSLSQLGTAVSRDQPAKHITQVNFDELQQRLALKTDNDWGLRSEPQETMITDLSPTSLVAPMEPIRNDLASIHHDGRTDDSEGGKPNSVESDDREYLSATKDTDLQNSSPDGRAALNDSIIVAQEEHETSPGILQVAHEIIKATANEHNDDLSSLRAADPEMTVQTPITVEGLSRVTIVFRGQDEKGEWSHIIHTMEVDPSDPSAVQRMAEKNARRRNAVFYDRALRQVHPSECFKAAVEDGANNTVFVKFGDPLVVNEEALNSIARVLQGENDDHRTKRRG
ncbi:uncharacterized protein N7484_006094 [Penicillium longicatenatum]|uniref:uncharacterized protein n=1 Tax=Penicillium longicatenatum TaxID=1561947 RepID=UPI00254692D5|nr:uncharacterized protein N7484_006094 [Penicillium longicatenatum]KAJ5643587.1 hypothetical protein N7484_006094 [Penicillium longicatenatum]